MPILDDFLTDVADAIRDAEGSEQLIRATDFKTRIRSIPTGGAPVPTGTIAITQNGIVDVSSYANANVNVTGIVPKDVNFYDYEGTLLYSFTKTEFLALTEMPANPTHSGLVAQGWNWTLAEAKTYVTTYRKLNIGQMYTTVSGLSEFDIELTISTGLTIDFKMDGTKNWGDRN